MRILKPRKIGAKTPVYDHAGEILYFATAEKVLELLARPDVDAIGSSKKIHGVAFRGPDPALSMEGSKPRVGLEQPHQRDTYWNPAGVWTLNYIPGRLRELYEAVALDCGAKRRPSAHPAKTLLRRPAVKQPPVPCLPLAA